MRLRPYQVKGLREVQRLLAANVRRVLVVAPTGAGKGTMAAAFMHDELDAGRRVLFLVHRREIVADMRERLDRRGACGADVLTVQSMLNSRVRYDAIIVDEAHHYRANEWRAVLDRAGGKTRIVGFTATPQRADGRAMGDVFDSLVDVVSYSQLLRNGHIVPCRVLTSPVPLEQSIASAPEKAYVKYADRTSALVFERDARHARATMRRFERAGVKAGMVLSVTPREKREAVIDAFRAGKLQVLINVHVLTEGVDMPFVHTVILARSCEHVGTYMQIVGRALRANPGKKEALLIDLSGSSLVHGEPTADREYNLQAREGVIREAGRPRVSARYAPRPATAILNLDLVPFTAELRAQTTVKMGKRTSRKFVGGIDWSKTKIGKVADQVVADDLGLHLRTIIRTRKRLGIPAFNAAQIDYDNEPRLGKMHDHELASLLGVQEGAVAFARRARAIPSFARTRNVSAKERVRADPDLGRVSDRVIAVRHGIKPIHVHAIRNDLGIPAFGNPGKDWKWEQQPLGKVSDAKIAARLGCSAVLVQKARLARGISIGHSQSRAAE